MNILIADDEADVRDAVKMVLELRGHKVNVVVNGEDAVNVALQSPPDVILMDVRMPIMDGITATRLLRSRRETEAVPIICLSSYLGEHYLLPEAIAAGCLVCLPKPLDWAQVEEALARLQNRGR